MIFMMQNVDQMMESLSWYVLLQIKLNKYIKINMYWTKKKYLLIALYSLKSYELVSSSCLTI